MKGTENISVAVLKVLTALIKVCSIGIGWGIKENLVTQHHLLKRCVTILSECTTMCSLTVFVPGGEESL